MNKKGKVLDEKFSAFIDKNLDMYYAIDELVFKAKSEKELNSAYERMLAFHCLYFVDLLEENNNSTEIKLKDIDEDSILHYRIINPIKDSLKDFGITINEESTFHTIAAKEYLLRVINKGEYSPKPQGQRYKFIAFKKMFGINKKDVELTPTEYKYRDTLTSDYSDRMNCLLKVLKQSGTKEKPAIINKNGYSICKVGGALDDSDIELFHYLIGELEEHKCETNIKFKKSDFINNIGYKSKRGSKLDNLTLSLMNLNAQSIAIIDERNDKVGKRLAKKDYKKIKGTQLVRTDFETNGDIIYIKFTSPFSKYFREQDQFGRLLDRKIISKFLYSNPRILKIARELSRMVYISEQKTKIKTKDISINYDTLIKNIGELDNYNNYSNKRVYLQRLTKDIEKAYMYISQERLSSSVKKNIIKPTPSTLKNGKIQLTKSIC